MREPERARGPWLEALRAALDEASAPLIFFFRDDDAGWEDARLFALLEVFARRALPLDVAVIPRALSAELATSLMSFAGEQNGRLGLHQHGLAHVSHEPSGHKCEFGTRRDLDTQRRDITEGFELLAKRLPGMVQPVFTPPWNRCTRVTGQVLNELGFRVLSRHISEEPLALRGHSVSRVATGCPGQVARRRGAGGT